MLQHTRRRWPAIVVGLLAALLTTAAAAAPASAAPATAQAPAAQAPAGAATAGIPPVQNPCYYASLCLYRETSGALTTWSLLDVGPTPYWYSIFNVTTGARLAICGTGTSCTSGIYIAPPPGRCYSYVAYVGSTSTTAPPAPVQRQSATLTLCSRLG